MNYLPAITRISYGCMNASIISSLVIYTNIVYYTTNVIDYVVDNSAYIDIDTISCLPDDIDEIKQEHNTTLNNNIPYSISLCGGGFKLFYQIGVYKAVRLNESLFNNKMHYIGASLGSFFAVLFTSELELDNDILPKLFNIAELYRTQPYSHFTKIGSMIRKICHDHLPDNIHEIISGKCHITIAYLTIYGFKKDVISNFYSKQDVIDCLMASQYIPIWTDVEMHRFRNNICIDSGYLDNFPIINDKTITVKCNQKGDVTLSDKFNLSTFYPSDNDINKQCILEGFLDMTTFLQSDACKKKWGIKIDI